MHDLAHLERLARLIRQAILRMTTAAGSGHPTSSLSAVELMTALLFGGHFRYDPFDPLHRNNDRLIFSKGHASPLYYALWYAADILTEDELLTYRQLGSPLEGHPTSTFPLCEAATGSLGQGLSIGLGMALAARNLDKLPYRTFVLLGDSELAEGSQWEAMLLAAHYRLDNLVGILDVNRLGQRGETMFGHDLAAYQHRIQAFGWQTLVVDGHDVDQILQAYAAIERASHEGQVGGQPWMIIARTLKGKGVPFLEDHNGWHGVALKQEDCAKALATLGPVDQDVRGELASPLNLHPAEVAPQTAANPAYALGQTVATRQAYGAALARLAPAYPHMVALDAEVSNSTYAEQLAAVAPERFFEMFVAEQNMVGAAIGLSRRGYKPCVSTFAAFFTRAYDQIRMSQYSEADILFCGSHCGVSIGADGPSQMGLEDVAMFRAVREAVVLYPADALACERLVEAALERGGLTYLRTTRAALPVLYGPEETFPIGGSKVLRQGDMDEVAVVAAGITVHEALAAADMLAGEGISIRVIDAYSVKPMDADTLQMAALDTGRLLVVEDHGPEGGLGEAVLTAVSGAMAVFRHLAVRCRPMSGTPQELLDMAEISRGAIVAAIKELLGRS